MISDLTASKQAEQELRHAESSAEQGKPMRPKKAAVKKARESAGRSYPTNHDSRGGNRDCCLVSALESPIPPVDGKLGQVRGSDENVRRNRSRHLPGDEPLYAGLHGPRPQGHPHPPIGDLLVVRLQGVLTTAEQHLVKTLQAEKGRDLLKQVRIQLMETARPIMEAMVKEITGIKVLTLHHDISTRTGEEVVLFTLAESPILRRREEEE